ncbi:MAG: aldo/keto reductase [Elusimicrobiota bacterium]|nr:aldo/keto reductase [Elusimicrobiota bacterium]
MEQRALGRSGLTASAVTLGTMNFGCDWHGVGAIDDATASSLVDLALERGVTVLDTADVYGRGAAEEMLGRVLGPRRQRVLLATKVLGRMRPDDASTGGLSARWIAAAAEGSLKRLRTDRIDLYMPHGWDPAVPLEESLEAFDRLVKAGKVRVLGCSNFSGPQLASALGAAKRAGSARFEFDQVQYSLAARFCEEDLVPVAAREGVSLLSWSPLAGGFLTGKYRPGVPRPSGRRRVPGAAFPAVPEERLEGVLRVLDAVARLEGLTPAQTALGWVLGRPGVASAVVGARTRAQLEETLGARPLSAKGAAVLEQASRLCAS